MFYPNNCYCINQSRRPPETDREEHVDQVKKHAIAGSLPGVPIFLGQPADKALQARKNFEYFKFKTGKSRLRLYPFKFNDQYNVVNRIETAYPKEELISRKEREQEYRSYGAPYLPDNTPVYLYTKPFGFNETYVILSTTPILQDDLIRDFADFLQFLDSFYNQR